MTQVVYLVGEFSTDHSVEQGLQAAQCHIIYTRNIDDSLTALQTLRHPSGTHLHSSSTPILLVATVQAHAMCLLRTLVRQDGTLPLTLLIDLESTDIQPALQAIRLGVRDYLLPSDPGDVREHRARALAEEASRALAEGDSPVRVSTHTRIQSHPTDDWSSSPPINRSSHRRSWRAPSTHAPGDLRWDVQAGTIYIGEHDQIRLSPVEARTFDLLFSRLGRTVSIEELIDHTLIGSKESKIEWQVQLLRTHLTRLRRRLEANPDFGYRIENVRGSGYVML